MAEHEITIGRLRGGLCVQWTENGKRRRYQLEARTLKEAEAEGRIVYQQKRLGAYLRASTVRECWNAYHESLQGRATHETMKSTGKAVLAEFGDLHPSLVTTQGCKAYARDRMGQGKSQNTVWTELGHLSSALNFAAKQGLIDRAPAVWKPTKPQTEKRILDRGEARALIEGADSPHIRPVSASA